MTTGTRSEHLTRRIPRAGTLGNIAFAWAHRQLDGPYCSALIRTVRRPSFEGPIAFYQHRMSRIRFPATKGLIPDDAVGPKIMAATETSVTRKRSKKPPVANS